MREQDEDEEATQDEDEGARRRWISKTKMN